MSEFSGLDGRGEGQGAGKALTSISAGAGIETDEKAPRLLFGALRTSEGYRVTVSYVANDRVVSTKMGADQLKHHALAMVESLMAQYVIDSYNEPLKFFETVQVR